jgi:hypothetical protein
MHYLSHSRFVLAAGECGKLSSLLEFRLDPETPFGDASALRARIGR